MDFEIITAFPDLIAAAAPFGVTGRALAQDRYRLRSWNPRDYASDNYRRIDDRPYGGGPGMVMMVEPLARCLAAIRADRAAAARPALPVIGLSPQGTPLTQARVRALADGDGAILVCGRYEAIDQRFIDRHVDEELSIGDFVVSGGELPALLLVDAAVRLLPGVLNDAESAPQDSFNSGLLDCPHYTRPELLGGEPGQPAARVPPVLMSGNHREIERWRRRQAVLATARRRPDLLAQARAAGLLSTEDLAALAEENRSCGGVGGEGGGNDEGGGRNGVVGGQGGSGGDASISAR